MFQRDIRTVLVERLNQFPVVVLTGPRQSGKTTLLESFSDQYDYINLELPSQLERIQADPLAVLSEYKKKGLIIDEAQKFPELFSYVQVLSDQKKQEGQFILSGSQNFLLNQQITQSLAGRAAVLELLPLSYQEYQTNSEMPDIHLWDWLWQGGYPRPYQKKIPITIWLDNYVRTYLERDVRDLLKVKDLSIFQRFLKLCAGRHAQLLNLHELAIDAGISHTTASNWLSILETSYILFRVPPYYKNFNKRIIKSSKLYFYDSGLVCYLLGIDSSEHLSLHSFRGAVFEGYVMSSLKKSFLNTGRSVPLYFWNDSHKNEVDCIIEFSEKMIALEIKSTTTLSSDLFKKLKKWQTLTNSSAEHSRLIYAGSNDQMFGGIKALSWKSIDDIDKSLNVSCP